MNAVLRALGAKPFAIVGHRGAPALAPENTLASFKAAIEAGADVVECDVRLTKDGVAVVFHDETLSRLFGVDKKVSETPYSELESLRLQGEAIPKLSHVLSFAADRVGLLVEVKEEGAEEAVAEAVKELGVEKWVAVVSFSSRVLESFRKLLPAVPVGLIYAKPVPAVEECRRIGCDILLPHFRLATKKLADFAHRAGLKVVAWTVNSEELAKKLYASAVDAMATDDPRILASLREKLLGAARRG